MIVPASTVIASGEFASAAFEAGGCRHEIAITGRTDVDLARVARDLKPICSEQIALFEPRRRRAPMKRYLFLTMAVGDGANDIPMLRAACTRALSG